MFCPFHVLWGVVLNDVYYFCIIELPCEADVFIHIQYLSCFLISVINGIPLSGAMPANDPHASLFEQQFDKRLQDIPEYRNVFYWFRTQ